MADNNNFACGMFIDMQKAFNMQKAFDTVNRKIFYLLA